jgi:hypothetical protein
MELFSDPVILSSVIPPAGGRSVTMATHRCQFRLLSVTVLSAACLLAACTKKDDPVGPTTSTFSYGAHTDYAVASAVAVTIADSVSGAQFRFPNGGQGTLSVARILDSPADVPADGHGFQVIFSGEEEFVILLPRDVDNEPLLWYWCTATESRSDRNPADNVWQPITPTDTTANPAEFRIQSFANIGSFTGTPGRGLLSKRGPATPVNIWNATIKKSGYIWGRRLLLEELTRMTIQETVAKMSSSLQSRVIQDIEGKFLPGVHSTWVSSHTYYHPYVYLTDVSAATRILDPYFCYDIPTATANSVAHEVGHYLSHVVLGDDTFFILNGQAQKNHDIGMPRPARQMLEDYAYWSEYLKFGGISDNAGTPIDDPIRCMRPQSPYNDRPYQTDYPRKEGFGCALMVRMVSPKAVISSFLNPNSEFTIKDTVPTPMLSPADIYDALAGGKVTTTDALYRALDGRCSADDKKRLQVIAERIGWSYNGTVQVADVNGNPVSGVEVRNIVKINDNVFWTNAADGPTGANGICTLPRLFPGSSALLLRYNYDDVQKCYKDSSEVGIHVDYSKPTNAAITLEKCVVGAPTLDICKTNEGSVGLDADFTVSGTYPSGSVYTFGGIATDYRWKQQVLTWSGLTFNCSYNENGETLEMHGTISTDGKTLVSLVASRSTVFDDVQTGSHVEMSASIEVRNLPRTFAQGNRYEFYLRSATVKDHITSVRFANKEIDKSGTTITDCHLDSTNWDSAAKVPVLTIVLDIY